jgi:hypothetical protein
MPARFALGAVVPAIVIVAIVVITTGGSSDRAKLPPPAPLPALVQTYKSASIGVSGHLPSDWSALRGQGFVRMTNRDGTAQIAVVAQPSTPGKKLPLLGNALASIRKTYGSVTVKHGNGTSLGGLPARSLVLYTRNQHKVPIRILLAAAQGPRLAYILEAFNALKAPLHDLVETQQIVIALRLSG